MDEKFLFPFEKVPQGATVLIYGAGELGQSYVRQIMITNYCRLLGMVDRNFKEYKDSSVPVYSPEQISSLTFDYVVVAVKGKSGIPEIKRILNSAGVDAARIIYVEKRNELPCRLLNQGQAEDIYERLAFQNDKPSIAFFIFSGIGGLLFIKRFLIAFVKLLPECHIDIYFARCEAQMRYLYSDISNINMFVYNLGARYDHYKENYDLAMRIKAGGFMLMDVFHRDRFLPHNKQFVDTMMQLQLRLKKEEYREDFPRISLFLDRRFNSKNCYTTFSYDVLDIHTKKVPIPLTDRGKRQFDSLELKKFITVNYGNGASKDISNVAKAWPINRFNQTVALFKGKYPDVKVVQIGDGNAERILNADCYILGEPFEFVAYILKNSMLHLDIEGGLVHLATQLGTKCIVLFGPTPEFYYGYEENINIKAGNCHDCCGVYLDSNRCARGMEEPECMYNITPEIVMGKINDYFAHEEIENMEATKNAKGFDGAIRAWIDHLGDELGFSDGRFFDVSRGKELEFSKRSQSRDFEYIDDEDVIFKSSDVILDVGSGSLPKFGKLIQGKQIDYRPIDPLAYEYQKLHDKYKIESPCDTLFGFMEILSAFIPENTADFVICHNAMDPSIDAPRSLMECLKVAKVGGTVLLNHAQCEAENADYRGLHQWNITVEKQDLIFYSKQDRYNISSLISCFCDVVIKQTEDSHSGKEMIHAKILKKSNVPVEIKEKYDTAAYAGYIISAIMKKMADNNTIYRPSGENVIPDNTKYLGNL